MMNKCQRVTCRVNNFFFQLITSQSEQAKLSLNNLSPSTLAKCYCSDAVVAVVCDNLSKSEQLQQLKKSRK